MPLDDLIFIGRIAKAHGIRGELRIACDVESPDILRPFLFLRQSAQVSPQKYKVLGLRMHHEAPLIQLEGVPDRTAAELLRGCEILIPQKRLPELDDYEFYLYQLKGLSVLRVCDDGHEEHLGIIDNISTQAGQEIWSIITQSGREVLFPAAPEFVSAIDLDAGIARITPPPGLLELYLD